MNRPRRFGVTLLELLVALLIISILSSVAVGVYTSQVERARYARARDEIRQLEVACHRYEVDTGQFPPTGSKSSLLGCGWLQLTLLHSLSGNAYRPIDFRWQGPYVDFDSNQFGDISGGPVTAAMDKADVQFLDPWNYPYQYVRYSEYESSYSAGTGGFTPGWDLRTRGSAAAATTLGTQLPTTSPYYASETWYNPTTFQILSHGHDNRTLAPAQRGMANDDVTNFTGNDM